MQSSQKILAAEFRQWLVLGSILAARMLMVVLDSNHYGVPWEDILKDIYHFVNQLAPVEVGGEIGIRARSENDMIDGIKQKKTVHQVASALTGEIVVQDVIYITGHANDVPQDIIFRRLCFERTESYVHSEAPISTQGPNEISGQVENKKVPEASRTRKKGKPKKLDSQSSDSHASSGEPKVEHIFLTMGFHKGVIAGLLLFSLHSKRTSSAAGSVKTVIIGLGPGILSMFMRNCLPSLNIEVVELDPVVLNVAKEYFGFVEDENLKVHITEATKFVREKANSEAVHAEGKGSFKVDVLIIDVDSSDSSSGLISPEADFVEESFLLSVKDSLSDKGLFIVKLVSRYSSVKDAVYSRLRKVFGNLYGFHVNGDFVEIIFALKSDSVIDEHQLSEACDALAKSLENNSQDWAKKVLHDSSLIKPLP